jgi:hypothetical protein
MHTRIFSPALLALLLTSSLVMAQSETPKAETPKAQDPHGQVKPASAVKVQAGTPLEFNVTGLTEANADKVEASLIAMERKAYVCDGCKHEQATNGRCTPCKLDLKMTKAPMFFEVVPSFETQTIRLTPMAASTLRYSDLDAALLKGAIKIDAAKFRLAGQPRLILRGGKAEDVEIIEKALVDAKLFDKVEAETDAATGDIHVKLHASATPPLRSEVISVVEGLGTKAKVVDVIWGPLPATKA